jgi:hypothetical protein
MPKLENNYGPMHLRPARVKRRTALQKRVGAVEELRLALVEAVARARTTGSTMNVTYDADGFEVSEFIPAREYRREWLRVGCDGRIENGYTKKIIGTAAELGL